MSRNHFGLGRTQHAIEGYKIWIHISQKTQIITTTRDFRIIEHFTKLVTEVLGKYLLRSISAALRDNLIVGFIVTQKIPTKY